MAFLQVGDGQRIYWEEHGNPTGRAAVVLHGGPGSGLSRRTARFFDLDRYRVILFDQRNCGQSSPHAADLDTDLAANTTQHLVADIERLRLACGVDRWLVYGASWGSTLALAYMEANAERVWGAVLAGVTTGLHDEVDWVFRGGLASLYPEAWDALVETVGSSDPTPALAQQLNDAKLATRQRAADAWCRYEQAILDWPSGDGWMPRFNNRRYRLAFARIVNHYVSHDMFLPDRVLLRGAPGLWHIPAYLVNGSEDVQAVVGAWQLSRVWPGAKLRVVRGSGHAADANLDSELRRALDKLLER